MFLHLFMILLGGLTSAQTILHKVKLPCVSDQMGAQFILRNNRINTITIMVEGEMCKDLQFFADSSRYIKKGCDLFIEPQLDSQTFSDFSNLWYGQFPIYILHSGGMDTLNFTVLPPSNLNISWDYNKDRLPQGIRILDSCDFEIELDSSTILFQYKDSVIARTFSGTVFPEYFIDQMADPNLKGLQFKYAYYLRNGVAVRDKYNFTHTVLHNN
ncbi:hypothetical protein GYB22_06025 [bacterium]|nr:hypothetical protein [bacterium]